MSHPLERGPDVRQSREADTLQAARAQRATAVVLFALVLASGCARPKETTPPVGAPPMDDSAKICTALAVPGPLADRFATIFPLERGGVLLVVEPAGSEAVARALEPYGFREARLFGCQPDSVVMFIPGADSRGEAKIEERLLATLPASRVREKLVAPPRSAPRPSRSTSP